MPRVDSAPGPLALAQHGCRPQATAQVLRELGNPRSHHLLAGIDYLVEATADCSWKGFIDACNQWLANADPDGELPDEHTRNRRCSMKKRSDTSLHGSFDLDTIAGDAVKKAIEREAQAPANPKPRTPRPNGAIDAGSDRLSATATRTWRPRLRAPRATRPGARVIGC